MIGELGTTSDPEVLIPGSPHTVRLDADDLEARARDMAEAAERIRARTVEGWSGSTAEGWATRQAGLSTTCDAVAEVCLTVAAALRRHGDVLAEARRDAQDAVALWNGRRGSEEPPQCLRAVAWSPAGGTGWLTGSPATPEQRTEAELLLAAARTEVRSSGAELAGLLRELSAGLPDGRWHTGQFFQGVLDWALGIVTLAWSLSPLRTVVDTEGALADNAEMAAGAISTWQSFETDPYNTTALVFDARTLQDDPALWWGRAAPDLALAVMPGAVSSAGLSGLRWVTRGTTVPERVAAGVGSPVPIGVVQTTRPPGYLVGPGGGAFVAEAKFDFLFGRVTSNEHNMGRSRELAEQLARVGFHDTPVGREALLAHFDEVLRTSDNISRVLVNEYGFSEVRDSLLVGPLGFVKFESTWLRTESGLRLSTVVPYGRF